MALPMPPILPEDVVDVIASLIPSTYDLLSISTTCRAWRVPGQRHAYRDLPLQVRAGNDAWLQRHEERVLTSTSMTAYVRTLRIGGNGVLTFPPLSFNDVVRALRHLPNVVQLVISEVLWITHLPPTPCPVFPMLRRLHISHILFGGGANDLVQPLQPMSLAPLWTYVEISDIFETTQGVLDLPNGMPVNELKLFNEPYRFGKGLTSFIPSIYDLHTLELHNYNGEDFQQVNDLVKDNADSLEIIQIGISPAEPSKFCFANVHDSELLPASVQVTIDAYHPSNL